MMSEEARVRTRAMTRAKPGARGRNNSLSAIRCRHAGSSASGRPSRWGAGIGKDDLGRISRRRLGPPGAAQRPPGTRAVAYFGQSHRPRSIWHRTVLSIYGALDRGRHQLRCRTDVLPQSERIGCGNTLGTAEHLGQRALPQRSIIREVAAENAGRSAVR